MRPTNHGHSTPASSPFPASLPQIGQMLDQFRLVRLLGRGGMGVVYEAEDTLLLRRVAIKMLWVAGDAATMRGLLREARAAAKLDHPNVLRVYHIGQWAGGYYLVLELLNGGSLQDRLRGGPMPWTTATWATMEACKGVAAAHAARLIHRDLKPSNLMCGEGVIKVCDFGLVRGGDLTTTLHAGVAGTPMYMSPEQWRGDPTDERSDVYALGATYYHLLTGKGPYDAPTPAQVMFGHCMRPVPDARAINPDLPEGCAAIVAKAIAKEPADRFQSAEELRNALAALQTNPLATTIDLVPPPRRPARRRRPRLLLLALGACALLGIGIVIWFQRTPIESQPTDQENNQASAPESTPQTKDQPRTLDPVLSADGRTITLGGKVRAVAVSADGKLLAAGITEPAAGAAIWELPSGMLVRRLDWGKVHALAFSPHPRDDLGFLLGGCAQGVMSWDIQENRVSKFVSTWEADWGDASTLAIKDRVCRAAGFSTSGLSGHVTMWTWDGNGQLGEFKHPECSPVRHLAISPVLNDGRDIFAIGYGNGDLALGEINFANKKTPAQIVRRYPAVGWSQARPLAFAPDCLELAVGHGRLIEFWHPVAWVWKEGLMLSDNVHALAYSPQGDYLATVGSKGMVALWDVTQPRPAKQEHPVQKFPGHAGDVSALAWTPDGRTLITAGDDGTVRLWKVPPHPRARPKKGE